MTIHVFIGSTSKDLAEYRQAAIDTCLKLDLFPVAMEHFEAMPVGATEGSKRKVADSDLYVGLFGFRYGYIEDGYDRSVTEIEFDYAGEIGLDRLCFLADPSHPWPPDHTDPKNWDKLEAFKQRIDKSLIRALFTTVDNFAAALMHALVKWKETNQEQRAVRSGELSARVIDTSDVQEAPRKLIGRDEKIAEIRGYLDAGERVLLYGLGGTGKTALAATVVSQWIKDGKGPVLWLKAGSGEAGALFEALAAPFGGQKEAFAASTDDDKAAVIRHILGNSGIGLLALDDAWNGRALHAILAKAVPRDLPVLITARQRHPIDGQPVEIPDLAPDKALELLGYHAGKDYTADANAADLCDTLGNLAFAVEIAGKLLKIRKRTPAELLAEVKAAPQNLKLPLEFAETGRECFANLLEVSLNALPDDARNVFLAFGALFSGTATAELLALFFKGTPDIPDELLMKIRAQFPQYVEMPDDELRELIKRAIPRNIDTQPVESALTTLEDHGLAERIPAADNAVPFYRVHDLAYAYARAQNDDAARDKALDACLTYTEHYNQHSLANFAALRPELDNFMGAADWAFQRERWLEVEQFAGNLDVGSEFLGYQGFYTQAVRLLEQAAAAAEKRGDRRNQGAHLNNLGLAYYFLGQYDKAIDYYEQALAIARETGNRQGEGADLCNLGNAYSSLGQFEKAIDYYQHALAIDREIGDRRGEGADLGNLGNAYDNLGQYNKAIEYHQQSLAIKREIGDRRGQGNSLGNLGIAYANLEQYEKAINYLEQALAIAREIGDRHGEGSALDNLGIAYYSLEQYDKAIDYHQQALAIFEALGLAHEVERVDQRIARAQAAGNKGSGKKRWPWQRGK